MRFYCNTFSFFIPLVYDLLDIVDLNLVDELEESTNIQKNSYYITSFFEFTQNNKIKDIILSNNFLKIIVDCSQEGNADIGEFESFFNFYKQNSLDINNLIFVTNNSNINKLTKFEFRDYNFNVIHYPGFFNILNEPMNNSKHLLQKTNWNTDFKKKSLEYLSIDDLKSQSPTTDFLVLNRSVRHHKLKFLEKIWLKNFFSEYDIRYTLLNMNCDYKEFNMDFRKYIFGPLGDNFKKTLPDETNLPPKRQIGYDGLNPKWLFDSKVNLVTESIYTDDETRYSDVIHISEKTWRCLSYGVPFVVISTKNTLKKIREYGFKTFNTCIDESYDEMSDDIRMDGVIKAAKELLEKWDSEEVQKICHYNRELYKNKKHKRKWIQDNFLNYLDN